MTVGIKRAYDRPASEDGYRILVDGMWPRGVRKQDADIERWMKELAPSKELRQWFGHDPQRWEAFRQRYREELAEQEEALRQLESYARDGNLTLVFAARETRYNNAVVLRELIQERLSGAD